MGLGKFARILKMGSGIAKPFIPGGASSILDIVNQSIDDKGDEGNTKGLKALAEEVEEMSQAILVLNSRLERLENEKT